ncbi:hypothetical protein CJD44_10570 [Streptomyces sp. alain-838]|nr:hypothetical protein CJD44_10570 [Streptomyces sp. alain-838]
MCIAAGSLVAGRALDSSLGLSGPALVGAVFTALTLLRHLRHGPGHRPSLRPRRRGLRPRRHRRRRPQCRRVSAAASSRPTSATKPSASAAT